MGLGLTIIDWIAHSIEEDQPVFKTNYIHIQGKQNLLQVIVLIKISLKI